MQADSSLPSLPWVQSVCFIRWCNRLLNNRQTRYELSYLFLSGCTYGGIFLRFSLGFNSFITRNMPLPSAGKAEARQAEKKSRVEFCKCIILLHLLHLVLEICEMQQDRDSGSPLPTKQSRIHSPGCLFPSLWRAPRLGKKLSVEENIRPELSAFALFPTLHVWNTVWIFENPFLSKTMLLRNSY